MCEWLWYYQWHDDCWDSEWIHDCSACPIAVQCEVCSQKWFTEWYIISLPRVLAALWHPYYYFDDEIKKYYDSWIQDRIICERKLINEDKTGATLFDQSDETIEAIGKLLWYNE